MEVDENGKGQVVGALVGNPDVEAVALVRPVGHVGVGGVDGGLAARPGFLAAAFQVGARFGEGQVAVPVGVGLGKAFEPALEAFFHGGILARAEDGEQGDEECREEKAVDFHGEANG